MTREEKKPRFAAFFYASSNRSRRQRAKKTSRLTCIVTGCRNGPIEFPITIGDTIASPSGDDVSSSDDTGGSIGDF
jgi:hypothetical protein